MLSPPFVREDMAIVENVWLSLYIVYECVCVFVFRRLSCSNRWTYGPGFWHGHRFWSDVANFLQTKVKGQRS